MSEPTDAGIQDPGGPQRPALPVRAKTVRIISLVLVVILLLAAGTALWLGLKSRTSDESQQQRGNQGELEGHGATALAVRVFLAGLLQRIPRGWLEVSKCALHSSTAHFAEGSATSYPPWCQERRTKC